MEDKPNSTENLNRLQVADSMNMLGDIHHDSWMFSLIRNVHEDYCVFSGKCRDRRSMKLTHYYFGNLIA
jgi:hypothetical protein